MTKSTTAPVYKFESDRERKTFEELVQLFAGGNGDCIPAIVEEFWDTPLASKDYYVYERKTRKLIGFIKNHFRRTLANTVDTFKNMPDGVRLRLMAIEKCDEHPKHRVYRIIATKADHLLVSHLSRGRIRGFIRSNDSRVNEGLLSFPDLKRGLKVDKFEIKYLEG